MVVVVVAAGRARGCGGWLWLLGVVGEGGREVGEEERGWWGGARALWGLG